MGRILKKVESYINSLLKSDNIHKRALGMGITCVIGLCSITVIAFMAHSLGWLLQYLINLNNVQGYSALIVIIAIIIYAVAYIIAWRGK